MRLIGINIPDEKRIEAALTYVYGIGPAISRKILKETKIDPNKRTKDLDQHEVSLLKDAIEKDCKVEGELRQIVRQNIGRLKDIQCYRGMRHTRKLPVHGQRTKTNSRTVRGNIRKTAISGKRKVELR